MGLLDRVFGGRRSRYERALDDLAEALSRAEHARAVALGREALALGEALYGARSAALSLPLYGLASALVAEGRMGEAEASLRRALDDLDPPSGDVDGAPRVRLHEMLASIVLRGRADVDATETMLRRWVDACRAAEPPDPVGLGAALNQLGLLLGRRDKRDEAKERFAEAARLRRDALGRSHRAVAEVLFNAATFRPATEPLGDVRAALSEALSMTDAPDRETRLLRAAILHNLGAVLEEMGDGDGARERYTESLALREGALGAEDASLRPTLVRLAQLHHREGRILFALPLYERALAIAARELGADHAIVKAIEAWKRELTVGAE